MNSPDILICVVDDDASIRKSLQRLLHSAGFAVEVFESARAYLDRPVHDGPSCLVLDLYMPELTGLGLQQELINRGREEPIVFITGMGEVPDSVRAIKAGAVDFLPKPFNDGEFLEAVNRALVRSRDQRQRGANRAEAQARLAELTPRERQVLAGVLAGKMNKEIAADLGSSIRTVKAQRGSMIKKTGVASVADLVRLVKKAGQ